MKNQLLTYLLFLLSITIYAQEFAPYGAEWHYTKTSQGNTSYLKMQSVDSVEIDGKMCRILDVDESCQLSGEVIVYSDPAGDSVYWYEPNTDEFQLIFAFDAQQGDQWSFAIKDYDSDSLSTVDSVTAVVDSVTAVNINGINLPKLYINYNPTFSGMYYRTIIKYIGGTRALFDFLEYYRICHDPEPVELRCYEDGHLGFYETGAADSCTHEADFDTYTETIEGQSTGVALYPNPVNSTLNVNLNNGSLQGIAVYDLSGREVFTRRFRGASANEYRFDFSQLPSGAYTVKINTEEKVSTHKLIKK